jgi:hypothetical protein
LKEKDYHFVGKRRYEDFWNLTIINYKYKKTPAHPLPGLKQIHLHNLVLYSSHSHQSFI